MPISSTGAINFGSLADNNNSGSKSNLSISTLANTYASGSTVGDVNSDGSINDTDRDLLKAAPHALSEFRGAEATNVFFGPITPQIASDASSVVSNGYVDEEAAQITFFVTDDAKGNQYKVGVKDASSNAILASNTDTVSGGDGANRTITFTAPATTAGSNKYYAFVESTSDPFANVNNTSQLLNHIDRLSGGSTSITNSGQSVTAADDSVSNVTLTPTVSTGIQTSTSIGTTVITGGDGGNISATNTSGTTFSIQNTPGVLRFDVTHIGSPSQARNSTTSTATATVTYVRGIDDVASLNTSNNTQTQFNSGDTIRIRAISRGIGSTTQMRIGFSTSNSNTGYSNVPTDRSIADSRFVRDTELVDTSHTLTSGTSLATFFPKAHYTSGTENVTAGSSFSVAPEFSYSATGNQTIDIDQTAQFGISSLVGNGASIVVASSPNIGGATLTSNGTTTMNPDDNTGNGTYTISYTGTANFNQSENASNATLTVRPIVSISSNNSAPKGLLGSYSSGLTPTGTSNESFTVTAATQGANLSYSWTLPSNFTDTAGGGSGDNSVTGFFSGGSSGGSRKFALTVTGNSVASSEAETTITYTGYTQQSISNVAPTSGNFRRGVTTLNVTFTSRNVAFAKILLIGVSTGTANKTFTASTDSLDSATADALESQSHSATITDVGRGDVGTYTVRVLDASDDNPSSDASGNITILDKAPVTPGAFNDASSLTYVGALILDWAVSDSDAYQYQIFKSSGDSDDVATYSQLGSNQSGTSITISQTSHTQSNGPFYYKVRAINFAQGPLSTEASDYNSPVRIKVQPTLSANNNQPQPALSTIFSTTRNPNTSTYPITTNVNLSNQSDNSGLGFSYSLNTSGITGNVPGITNASTTTPTITAQDGVGTCTVTLTVSADNQSNFVHSADTINVHYVALMFNVSNISVAGNGTINNQLSVSYSWQGLAVASARYELFNSSNLSSVIATRNESSPDAGGATQSVSSGTINFTSLASTFGISSGGTFVMKITLFSGASQNGTSISAFTDTDGFGATSTSNFNLIGLTQDGQFLGYDSLLLAAEKAGSSSVLKHILGSVQDGNTLFNDSATLNPFDGDPEDNDTSHHYNFDDQVFIVNDSGVISSLRSDTPNTPTLSGTAVSTSTTDLTIRVTGNTEVTRKIGIHVSPQINSKTTEEVNASSQGSSTTTDISLATAFGANLSSGTTYTVKVRGENNHITSPYTSTATFATTGVLSFGTISGGPTSLTTTGNLTFGTDVTGTAHQLSVSNSTGGSITLRGIFTGGSTPDSADGELSFGMSFSNNVSSFNNNTLNISSGATQTVYIKFELSQTKPDATASGTAQWRLSNNGAASPRSNAIAATWDFNTSSGGGDGGLGGGP